MGRLGRSRPYSPILAGVIIAAVLAAVVSPQTCGLSTAVAEESYPRGVWPYDKNNPRRLLRPNETEHLQDYYSPFGSTKAFFATKRPVSKNALIIGAGFGRTGTTTMWHKFHEVGMHAWHENLMITKNIVDAALGETHEWRMFEKYFNRTGASELALLDHPVPYFTWDLLDSHPESRVVLTLRQGPKWVDSLNRLNAKKARSDSIYNWFLWGPGNPPRNRDAIKRMMMHNSKILATIPESKMWKCDVTLGSEEIDDQFLKFVGSNPDANVSKFRSFYATTGTREGAHALMPIDYYTSPFVKGSPVSDYWGELPASNTSSKPLVILAGFDGTGLVFMRSALETLGMTVKIPGLEGLTYDDYDDILENGFRNVPGMFDHVDAIGGHPVPYLLWDLLQAYPKAKVILTVRDPDVWYSATTEARNFIYVTRDKEGLSEDKSYSDHLNKIVFGWQLPNSGKMNRKWALRKYFEYNSYMLHTIPAHKLLVMDVFEDKEREDAWERLCWFLGKTVPDTAFPSPSSFDQAVL